MTKLRILRLGTALLGLVFFAMAGTVQASWIGQWNVIEPSFRTFDFYAIRIHPNSEAVASFQNPGVGNFTDSTFTISLAGDWEHVATTPFLTAASGSERSNLGYRTFFEQDLNVLFTYEVAEFLGDQFVHSRAVIWPGFGGVGFSPSTWAPTRAEIDAALFMVPEPSSLALFLAGLVGLGFKLCRRDGVTANGAKQPPCGG